MAPETNKPSPNTQCSCLILATFLITFITTALFTTFIHDLTSLRTTSPPVSRADLPSLQDAAAKARKSPETWLRHLYRTAGQIRTNRIGCREVDGGGQSCVYEGFLCIDVEDMSPVHRPGVMFVDDRKTDFEEVPSDDWCNFRHQSADPRYFASRHWPILEGTVAPQWSCLNATYRTARSLFGKKVVQNATDGDFKFRRRIKWMESLWVMDLDYHSNDHNNHLFMDIVWLLDVVLWQKALDPQRRPGMFDVAKVNSSRDELGNLEGYLFEKESQHVYLPQSEDEFMEQTGRDVNRLIYSLVLQLDSSRLYPNLTDEELHTPSEDKRRTVALFDAFPELKQRQRLMFHKEMQNDPQVDLVCAPRVTSGAKVGNAGHERVCRFIRGRAWDLYGIPQLPMRRVGQVYYPQPPKRIIILHRHLTRRFDNLDELESGLRNEFEKKQGVEVELVTTAKLQTAEEFVRVFSRAGVVITPHGSQNFGAMFMPRHSALIEVMPVAYFDYAFNLLSESCKIWYYELQSMIPEGRTEKYYRDECGDKLPHMLNPCTGPKSEDVNVNVSQAIHTIRYALERIGYPMRPWLKFVREG